MPPQIGIVDHAACLGHQVITDHSYTAGKRASRVARRRNRENSRFIGDQNPGSRLRVRAPTTGQDMTVTVPAGVASGGLFDVPLPEPRLPSLGE